MKLCIHLVDLDIIYTQLSNLEYTLIQTFSPELGYQKCNQILQLHIQFERELQRQLITVSTYIRSVDIIVQKKSRRRDDCCVGTRGKAVIQHWQHHWFPSYLASIWRSHALAALVAWLTTYTLYICMRCDWSTQLTDLDWDTIDDEMLISLSISKRYRYNV